MKLAQSQPSIHRKVTLHGIPSGKRGIHATLKIMRRLTRDGKRYFPLRELALSLVRNLNQKNWLGEIRNLHEFVRDEIRYVKDINGIETVSLPQITVETGQGDCDDKSVLLATLLESIGHPTRFVAVGFSPGHYVHVLVETKVGNKWIPLETTEPVPVGWYPKGVVSRMEIYN